MADLILPESYKSSLGLLDTQRGIKIIKDDFECRLARALKLARVSAPMFVRTQSGLNDDLSGVERAVAFDIPSAECNVQVIHSLAKWKRFALGSYGFSAGEGLYTDMNAIRRDETLDNLHSVYVDQWDWEKIITPEERNIESLKSVVKSIVRCMYETECRLADELPGLPRLFRGDVEFITSEQLLKDYPQLSPREREDAAAKRYGTIFVIGIGAALSDGLPHDTRAPDYDDWSLNGDILEWYPLLGRAVELSSMGIRVDPAVLVRQLEISGKAQRLELPFHRSLVEGRLPQTIGGGIGQSRLCMLMLGKAHIGEVQASVWPQRQEALCRSHGIMLL